MVVLEHTTHHLASGNPGTPFRHARTERPPNMGMVTQQVCVGARAIHGLTFPVGGKAGSALE